MTLINVENFTWLATRYARQWPFDTVVFDECSLFRNPDSKRFKAARKIRPYTQTVFNLTATPAPKSYLGLWSQVYLIDGGERLGKNITAYRNKFFYKHYDGYTWLPKEGAKEQIQELIKDLIISLDPTDYMELGPEPIHEYVKLEFPDDLREEYDKLEKEYLLKKDGLSVVALSEAAKATKLKQFCNGCIYAQSNDDENKKEVIDVHDLKIDALKQIIETMNGNPIIVAHEYKHERDKILKAFPQAKTMKQFNQEKWDNGEIEILLIHPKSGGHGISLQHGGYTVAWYSTTIDLELYDQLNGRIGQLRQSQSGYNRAPVYYHLYIDDTVEGDIAKKRQKKDVDQQGLINAIRSGMKSRVYIRT